MIQHIIIILLLLFLALWGYTIKRLRHFYLVQEGINNKPLASSAGRIAEAKQRKPVALSFGLQQSVADTSNTTSYTDRIVEMQKMIDVLSNPNKTQSEKVEYLLSSETPFKLRNDKELQGPINSLQSCIKSYLGQIVIINNQIRAKRPVSRTKFDQKNVCTGTECMRYDQADAVAKYLEDNANDIMKQVKYLLAPDFVLAKDPDYNNLLTTLRNGCISTNLTTIVTFTKKIYQSWIENDSANLQIIQCKGKDMFTAECAENAKKNAIKAPNDVAMNTKSARPIPRASKQTNPALRGLVSQTPGSR